MKVFLGPLFNTGST